VAYSNRKNRSQSARFHSVVAYLFIAGISALLHCVPPRGSSGQPYLIYALKYGESEYPAGLMNSEKKTGYVRMNWLAYLVCIDHKNILIDTGFSDAKLLRAFKIEKFRAVPQLITDLGLNLRDIDTIILTHAHFDHAGGIADFPEADIIMHESEPVPPEDPTISTALLSRGAAGKLRKINAPLQLTDSLRIVPTGGHTRGSLIVELKTRSGKAFFTGDECYFSAECKSGIPLPPAAAYSQGANLDFIKTISDATRLFTGHENNLTGGRWQTNSIFYFDVM
jgi:N-acyl homoserine lactone hydrolase